MQSIAPLSNTVGSVLDPIISLRRTVTLPANETAVIDLVLGVAESREAALAQVEKYQAPAWPTAPSIWPGPTAR
jgi:cyclic beta-1,2-glucan synthetase